MKTLMNNSMKTILFLSGILLLLFIAACAPLGQQSGTINIGFMAPLSGDAASSGLSILKGAQLAVKEAGLSNVKLITEDSKCDSNEAVSAINKLISVNKVVAIVGEVCSDATLAAAPLAEQNEIVMISAASTSPEITQNSWVFRTVPSDALLGAFGAKLVYQDGHRTLAVLYSNEEYGVGFNTVLEEEFPARGGEVVTSEAFERGTVDLRTQLTKIKNSGADAVYIISNSPDSAVAALKQLKEIGLNVAVYGSEGLKSPAITDGAGRAAEGLIVTSVSSGNIGFMRKYQEAYGEEPGLFAAQAYDAFKAVSLAIQQGAKSGEDFKAMLPELSFDGASGHIDFDSNGDIEGNYEVYVVEEGEFVPR